MLALVRSAGGAGALLSDWQLSTKCKGDCEIMGSRKIIKQVQVPAETTGNLYTLTENERNRQFQHMTTALSSDPERCCLFCF